MSIRFLLAGCREIAHPRVENTANDPDNDREEKNTQREREWEQLPQQQPHTWKFRYILISIELFRLRFDFEWLCIHFRYHFFSIRIDSVL